MANRWCEGFGRYGGTTAYMLNGSSGQAWAEIDGGFSLSNANPRTGLWHLRMAANAGAAEREARRVFGAALTEVFLGIALYCASLPTNENSSGNLRSSNGGLCLFSLRDAANNEQVCLWLGTDGGIEATRGATVLGRSAPVIGAGAYQHIEVYAKAHATAGAIEVRVDEVTKLNLTGIDTLQSANAEFSQWAIGAALNGATAQIDIADCFCNDTVVDGSGCSTFVGDCKSGLLLVNADTTQADFALSAGATGYTLLGEAPPDDSTYISTASAAAESDFGLQDGPSNLAEILTCRPFIRAMKNDAGTCTVAPNMKSSGTKGPVSSQPITTAFAYYDTNVPVDPHTGVPWVLAGLNAALNVVERTA